MMMAKLTYQESLYIQNIKQALQTMDEFGSKIKIVASDENFYVSNILRMYSPILNLLLDQPLVLGVPTLVLPETTSHSVKMLMNLLKEGSVETGPVQGLNNINSVLEVAQRLQIEIQSVEIKCHEAVPKAVELSGNNSYDGTSSRREASPLEDGEIRNNNNNVDDENFQENCNSMEVESFFAKLDPSILDMSSKSKKVNNSLSGVRCPRCLKAFPHNTDLISHLDKTLGKSFKRFECPVNDCEDCYFDDLHSLLKHRKKHHLKKREFLEGMVKMTKNKHNHYQCPKSYCRSAFPELKYMLRHAGTKHSITEENIMLDILNVSVNRDLRCPICNYVFKGCKSAEIISHGQRKHDIHPCSFYERLISADIKC